MSPRLPSHRWRPLLALVLALGLTACGRPRPTPPPAAPAAPPTAAPTDGPTEPQARRQLQAALASADDQFNRGENDLACGQVQRAQGLMQQRADRATPAQREQLLRFQRACSTL